MTRDDACNCFCVSCRPVAQTTQNTHFMQQAVVPAVVAADQPASLSLDFVTENIKHVSFDELL